MGIRESLTAQTQVDTRSDKTIDSLKFIFENAKHDSVRLSALTELGNTPAVEVWKEYHDRIIELCEKNLKIKPDGQAEELYSKYLSASLNFIGQYYNRKGEIKKAAVYYWQGFHVANKINYTREMAISLNSIGANYEEIGDTRKALYYYGRSLELMQSGHIMEGAAAVYVNMALIYFKIGDVTRSLDYNIKGLQLFEQVNSKYGIAFALGNLAVTYNKIGDREKAINLLEKSLVIREETNDKYGIAITLNNMSNLYKDMQGPQRKIWIEKALKCNKRSLALQGEIGDRKGEAVSFCNIALILIENPEYAEQNVVNLSAIEYLNKALAIYEKMNIAHDVALTLRYLSAAYYNKKDFKSSEICATRSLKISRRLGYPESISDAAQVLYKIYKKQGNYKLTLENYELFIQMRDSLSNMATRKASIKSQLKYEYEKQSAADSVAHAKESEIKNVELKRQSAEIRAKKNQQYALFGGLFLVILFSIFMFNRFKVTQKQKVVIEHQKEIVEDQKKLVEEKQKEILDSIHYAKRIQLAQIPNEKIIAKIFQRLKK